MTTSVPSRTWRTPLLSLPPAALGAAGFVALLLLWQAVVQDIFSGRGTIPTPVAICTQFFATDGPSLYVQSASHTLHAAALGWLGGNLLAIAMAALVFALPPLEKPILLLGAVSYCVPIVAVGPLLVILSSGDSPRIILSAMSVFFVTLIGSLLGLRSVTPPMLDMVHAFGGGAWMKLSKARWRAALPSLFAALRVAAPSSILGAIVAEFLGAENGIGVLLINSQQSMNYPRTWAVAIFCAALAGAAYGVIGLAGHLLTPWARETHTNLAAGIVPRTKADAPASPLLVAARALLSAGSSILIVLFAWVLVLKLFHVAPFLGKGPLDVWSYLNDPDVGAENRTVLVQETGILLRDAFLGLGAGTGAALLTAALFQVVPALRYILMAPALALQSVPLVVMTPLIVLVFGRNLGAIVVIGGIVTFFPTLVNVSLALGHTPRDAMDLMRVLGASRTFTLFKLQVPFALPALFASLRVAAPSAITGALLAEWLATGQGLGYAIFSDVATSDYDALWTRVAVATFLSLLLYNVIGLLEKLVLGRMIDAR